MHFRSLAPKRAITALACTGTALSIGIAVGAGPAWAHVHVDADDPAPGATSIVTFQVPGESESGAVTTKLSVKLPNVASARTELMPGWTATLDRDKAAGTVSSVTWTANPQVGISSDQYALFRISVKLPEGNSVSFPATQTYSDGTVVQWDQPPLPGGGEPEHPAPELALSGTAPAEDDDGDHMTTQATPAAAAPVGSVTNTDNTARWLAGGAFILAAVGVVAAFVTRRRT
jgi:uncharacterized protein YcnI